MKSITGEKIKRISTIGSMYDNQCIIIYDAIGNYYLMKLQEMMKIKKGFNDTTFNIIKKRKYNYLEVK